MACCGTSIKKVDDKEALFRQLRDLPDLDCVMKLRDKYKCEFDKEEGKWRTNFAQSNDEILHELDLIKIDLETKLAERINVHEDLEKKYLARVLRLLQLAQTHCILKRDNDFYFEKYGIKKENHVLNPNMFPNANKANINNSSLDYGEHNNEKKKLLAN